MSLLLPHRRIITGRPPLWTPFLLGTPLRGWFDSRRSGSMTQAAGLVSAWASLVNDWTVVQGVGANQPQIASPVAWRNRQTLYFPASNHVLQRDPMPVDVFRNNSGSVIATSVEYLPHVGASHLILATTGTGNSRYRLGTEGTPAMWTVGGRRVDGTAGALRSGAVAISTGPALVLGSVEWSTASAFAHVNGATAITPGAFDTAGTVSDTRETRVAIGGTGFNWSGGYFGSVLLIGRLLTTDERQKWEGYEAHTLGSAGSLLPAGHPYRGAPPTASTLELEAFADSIRDIGFTFDQDRRAFSAIYTPMRGWVQGWAA